MNPIFNKIGAMRLTPTRFFGFWIALFAIVLTLTSCNDELDVQQSYPFTVGIMPYGDKIVKDETIELRMEIKPEGNYSNTMYTIRYFQYEGDGELKLVDGPTLVNNDRVLLESKVFRLNYTAISGQQHRFLVVVEDNFGSIPWEHTFEFNGTDSSSKYEYQIFGPIDRDLRLPVEP